jgi:threonine synthase
MHHILGFQCLACGRQHDYRPSAIYTCPSCGGNLDVVYDYAFIARHFSPQALAANPDATIRRWLPLLPIADVASLPPLDIGGTPLYHARRLGERLGLSQLYIKDDGRNPTASFKDRASAVAVAVAQELGAEVITTASSGNAGAALAGCAAASGMPSIIFVPHTAPRPKVAQLLMFGAQVFAVHGTYDQAFDLCLAASAEYGWYNRNTGYNPYTREGKKTCALEIAEQISESANQRISIPDKVVVAVGDGNIISGLWKGFRDLLALGWIERLPQLIGVQAAGAASLVRAWERVTLTPSPLSLVGRGAGSEGLIQPVDAQTIADSICVGRPRDGLAALRAVIETGGRFVAVSDDEILQAMRDLARGAAVFAEPSGATGFAGLSKLVTQGLVSSDERVVVVVTGSGLKDVEAAVQAGGQPTLIEPTLEGLRAALSQAKLAEVWNHPNEVEYPL